MKKTILIDLDETILVGAMKELTQKYLGKEINLSDIEPGKYINQMFPNDEFKRFFLDNNLYDFGVVSNDTIKVIKQLNEKYDVYIGTTYYFPEVKEESDVIMARKFNFLKKYLMFLGFSKFLFLGDKKLLNVDIAIGDSLSDLIGKDCNYLLNCYHNMHYDNDTIKSKNAIRVTDWNEIANYLLKEN